MSLALADMPLRDVVRALNAAGFVHSRTKGSHTTFKHHNGRVVVVPQHATIKRGTLASILRQAGLTVAEFQQLLR
jgi:predicted RNA binding protein YcfA (HicA-like mRNA interferase family)